MVNSWISYFVVFVLNKSLTYSSRTDIWDKTIESIRMNMLIGNGYMNATDVIKIIGMQNSHNMYLWHAFQGGIIYLTIFSVHSLQSKYKAGPSFSGQYLAILTPFLENNLLL